MGRVEATGEFAMSPADGATFTEGRFTATGVTVVVTQSGISSGQPCQTVTRWRGTKHGSANVFGRMPATDDADASKPGLSGAYLIRKTVTSDTCRPLPATPEVMTSPGVIARATGAPTFMLSDHGTRNLIGRQGADGTWSIEKSSSLVMEKIQATDVFTPLRLSAAGLRFTVTTDLAANPFREGGPACRVVTDWVAERMSRAGGAPLALYQLLTRHP